MQLGHDNWMKLPQRSFGPQQDLILCSLDIDFDERRTEIMCLNEFINSETTLGSARIVTWCASKARVTSLTLRRDYTNGRTISNRLVNEAERNAWINSP